jgi:hypothetical protein
MSVALCGALGRIPVQERFGRPRKGNDKNLRAVQLLLGHTKGKSTVRNLGIEVDDARAIAGQVGI